MVRRRRVRVNNQNMLSGPYGASAVTQAGYGKFPSPFLDAAAEFIPTEASTMFDLAEYVWYSFGTYKEVANRVVSYFLTEVVLEGDSDKERDLVQAVLRQLKWMEQLRFIGLNFMAYGSAFISLYFPFDRYLICPDCGTNYATSNKRFDWKFTPARREFSGRCRKCKKNVVFRRSDQRSNDISRMKTIVWNPRRMMLRPHYGTSSADVFLRIPARFAQYIREGSRYHMEGTRWNMIEACCAARPGEEPLLRLDPDEVYRVWEPPLAGIDTMWAVPPVLANIRTVYYMQLLRRMDQALAQDYIVPARVLYPENIAGAAVGQDSLATMQATRFVQEMQAMMARRRRDPTAVQISPFPLGYQSLGGEGATLSPKENFETAMNEFLNACGFPAQLFSGDLSLQSAPVALRLFEKSWGNIPTSNDGLTSWLVRKICAYFNLSSGITGKMRSVTLADDMERRALIVQAAAGGQMSNTTAFRTLDVDYMEEQRRVIEEQKEIAKLQQEAMADQQAAQASGAAPAPGPGGAPGPVTPGDVHQQARDLAHQLVVNTPETNRRGELIKIKHSNPTLHALVIQYMSELRQQFATQGQAAMIQQAKSASAAPDPRTLPSTVLLGAQLAEQVISYVADRPALRKIAMDIQRGAPGAVEAFRYVFRAMRGWA